MKYKAKGWGGEEASDDVGSRAAGRKDEEALEIAGGGLLNHACICV